MEAAVMRWQNGMWWWNDGWHYWSARWMFGQALMLLVVLLCVAMLVIMIRDIGRRRDALNLLKKRLARRQITQTEYEQRRRLLDA
jgi:hypothetical protein